MERKNNGKNKRMGKKIMEKIMGGGEEKHRKGKNHEK